MRRMETTMAALDLSLSSGKVGNMFKHSGNSLAIAMLCLTLPLAGCVTDEMYTSDITAYGGSKMHPIKVSGSKAYVEDCGQWPDNLADSESNELHDNHGCAVQANIAAMAAYPTDFAGKRKLAKPWGEIQDDAIDRFTSNSGTSTSSSTSSTSSSTTP
jgi:type IV pilus biogenesis protein CpaD/CtpE